MVIRDQSPRKEKSIKFNQPSGWAAFVENDPYGPVIGVLFTIHTHSLFTFTVIQVLNYLRCTSSVASL